MLTTIQNLFKRIFHKEPSIFELFPIGCRVKFVLGEFATVKYEGIVKTHGEIFDMVDCLGVDIDVTPTHNYRNYPVTDASTIVRID